MPEQHDPEPAAYAVRSHTVGFDRLFEVVVEPERSRTNGNGRDEIDFAVKIVPTEPLRTAIQFTYEFATPQGDLVEASSRPAVVTPGNGQGRSDSIRTPKDLPDGYYLLRISAAGSNERGTTGEVAEQYLSMQNGRLDVLDFEEWSKSSGINQAHMIVSEVQPTTLEEARAEFAAVPDTDVDREPDP